MSEASWIPDLIIWAIVAALILVCIELVLYLKVCLTKHKILKEALQEAESIYQEANAWVKQRQMNLLQKKRQARRRQEVTRSKMKEIIQEHRKALSNLKNLANKRFRRERES